MKTLILAASAAATLVSGAAYAKKQKGAKTTVGILALYEGQKFEGDRYDIDKDRPSVTTDFTIGSVAVFPGETWQICEKPRFQEPCMTVNAETTGLGRITIRSARIVK